MCQKLFTLLLHARRVTGQSSATLRCCALIGIKENVAESGCGQQPASGRRAAGTHAAGIVGQSSSVQPFTSCAGCRQPPHAGGAAPGPGLVPAGSLPIQPKVLDCIPARGPPGCYGHRQTVRRRHLRQGVSRPCSLCRMVGVALLGVVISLLLRSSEQKFL